MFETSFGTQSPLGGAVVTGTVVAVEDEFVVVDVGLKTEGRVALKEFSMPGVPAQVNVGDKVEVYLERVLDALGEAVLSRDKARREEGWIKLERAFNERAHVTGVVFGRVKDGFTVDLDGAVAFLPASQAGTHPMPDFDALKNQPQPFQILKMDRRRGNIVVSRRAVLEERRAEERTGLVASLHEKQVVEGVVKNITDYGAFVDLGGVEGLLHVTDIAWRRVSHPAEVLSVGQTVIVQIIKINREKQRISLGMKQLQTDPWEGVAAKYPPGAKFTGKVTNVTDYGAFVELEPGVEGLVHVSEMSWVKKNVAPSKIVVPGTEVEVQVLEVDPGKRRLSLGIEKPAGMPVQTETLEKLIEMGSDLAYLLAGGAVLETAVACLSDEARPRGERQIVSLVVTRELEHLVDTDEFVNLTGALLERLQALPSAEALRPVILHEIGTVFEGREHHDSAASYFLAAANEAIATGQVGLARRALDRVGLKTRLAEA